MTQKNIYRYNNMQSANTLFFQYKEQLRYTALKYTKDKTLVDDILHDFYISLINKPISKNISNTKSYLSRALRNDALDLISKNNSYHARNINYGKKTINQNWKLNHEAEIISTETSKYIFEIIEKILPPHEAEAIKQRYQFELNVKETAARMSVSPRSVSHYVSVGLKKLRKYLEENQKILNNLI